MWFILLCGTLERCHSGIISCQRGRRSIKNSQHSVSIGTSYAVLRAALEFSDQQLADWRGDHLLMGHDTEPGGPNYDRMSGPWIELQTAYHLRVHNETYRERTARQLVKRLTALGFGVNLQTPKAAGKTT